jgi:hypothetical protein
LKYIAHIAGAQQFEFAIDKAVKTVEDAGAFQVVILRGAHYRADSGIHTGRITPRGKHTDMLYGMLAVAHKDSNLKG